MHSPTVLFANGSEEKALQTSLRAKYLTEYNGKAWFLMTCQTSNKVTMMKKSIVQ